MVETANTIWADGPSGTPTEPDKALIRAWGTDKETRIAAVEAAVVEWPGEIDDLTTRVAAAEALVSSGIIWTPQSIKVRATGNVALASGLVNGTVLNGVTLATGDFVFLPIQTAPAENGIYTVPASGAASRATFADTAAELAHIGFVIQGGTVGTGERWTLPLAAGSITLGTTALTFAETGIEPGYAAEVATARGGYPVLDDRLDSLEIGSSLLNSTTIGKVPAVTTASLWTGLVYPIIGPVAEERTIDRVYFAGAAGTLVVYAAAYVSGTAGVDLVVRPLRSAQYDVAAGVSDIDGKGFVVHAGEYLVGHAHQGIYRDTSGGPGVNYLAGASIGQTGAAFFAAGMRAQLGFKLIGNVAAEASALTSEAIESFQMGLPLASMASATAWTGTNWIVPESPSPIDGFVTEAWAYGTGSGSLEVYVVTKNADGTYTATASASYAVGAGVAHVYPNLPIAKGQLRAFRHTGVVHRNLNTAGGLKYFYLNSAPTTSTAAASSVNGSNVMFGSQIEGTVRGRGTANDKRITALEGGSNVWAGRKWGALGTSITAGDSWVTSVAANLGMTVTDLGVGGGLLTQWNPGSGVIGGQIMAQIASLPTDCSLVTLEGFTNDIWNSAPLGVYTDKVQGTFYGALWAAFVAIKARCPNALVLGLIDHNGNSVNDPAGIPQEPQKVNGLGLSSYQYQEAMERAFRMAGYPCGSFGATGLGFFTPELMVDHIHPNTLQQPRTADYVTRSLRGLMPIT
ncbi:SGNH/GDSL hydrolase family protein [Mesorhizobium sp. M0520]|uniref:SGNH/GDSL hydrolase family protein n=1 Tax=Mesorhizobium sp. M0520 TaxID=2956957 RepID=UPI00333ACD53